MTGFMEISRRWNAAWATRSVQERRLLKAGALFAAFILALTLLFSLQEMRRQMHENATRDRQRLASMESMRTELQGLGSVTRPPSLQGEQLRADIEIAARSALAPATVSAALDTAGRVKLVVRGAAQERLLVWLDKARQSQHLRLEAITLKPQADGGLSAEIQFSGDPQ